MSWIMSHPAISFSYGFLYLSVLLLWLAGSKKITWMFTLFLSILLGLFTHQLDRIALIPIGLFAFASYYNQTEKSSTLIRVLAGVTILLLSIGLGAHRFPGFHNLKVLDGVYISHQAIPFTLYLNMDKTLVGIFILGLGYPLISRKRDWLLLLKQLARLAPPVILAVIVLALSLKFVTFDFKIPQSMLIWAVTNLLFVCMAEEAFFRGFIQKNLALIMKKIRYGHYYALFIAAILFGLSHYAGGTKYMILATVAGAGYGWVYMTTKRIEGSILTHFGLNVSHFLLFTYPALASAV